MPSPSAPAILFLPGGYQTTQADLMGLRVANRSFLQGMIRHGGLNTLHGYAPQQASFDTAFEQFARDLGATVPIRMIEGHRLDQLAEVGGLLVLDPNLAAFARHRSFLGSHAYTLTGVTHAPIISMMADLAVAPIQPWDAQVCTSRAVAAALEEVLGSEEARLAERLGATRFPRPLLPVIPLGVDAADFTSREEWRAAWRERLGIAAEEVVALYVGRLSRHGKAHPLPMLAALGRAARSLPQRLHLILAGWWLHPPEEAIWREQAAVFCPEVRLHLLDGRDEAVRREIRSAADMFTLLVDNVQESFGLAPVEAMAAGLPVVATDWDGFRDTVRHGVDGMLVPTLMAPPGEARDVALRHATSNIVYGAFLSLTARLTAVDIGAAADAFQALHDVGRINRDLPGDPLGGASNRGPGAGSPPHGSDTGLRRVAKRHITHRAAAAAGAGGGNHRPVYPSALYRTLPAGGARRDRDRRVVSRAAPPRRSAGKRAAAGPGACAARCRATGRPLAAADRAYVVGRPTPYSKVMLIRRCS